MQRARCWLSPTKATIVCMHKSGTNRESSHTKKKKPSIYMKRDANGHPLLELCKTLSFHKHEPKESVTVVTSPSPVTETGGRVQSPASLSIIRFRHNF